MPPSALLEILSETGNEAERSPLRCPPDLHHARDPCGLPRPDQISRRGSRSEHFQNTHDIIAIDGVRVPFGDGWGLLRASNTQPVLVLRFEAATEERLAVIRKCIEDVLDRILKSFA